MRFPAIDVLISTDFDPPSIDMAGASVVEITDHESAHFNANVLNTSFPLYKLAVEEGALVVKTYVQAVPLVPDHLFIALSCVTDLSRDLREQLVETFGGTPAK